MGYVTKLQVIKRANDTRQFYVICPSPLAQALEMEAGEALEWVVEDRKLLDLVHATAVDQSEKGRGYPVVLSESHERAVVRGAEREVFYRFLKDTFVKNDLPAEISLKSLKKMAAGV